MKLLYKPLMVLIILSILSSPLQAKTGVVTVKDRFENLLTALREIWVKQITIEYLSDQRSKAEFSGVVDNISPETRDAYSEVIHERKRGAYIVQLNDMANEVSRQAFELARENHALDILLRNDILKRKYPFELGYIALVKQLLDHRKWEVSNGKNSSKSLMESWTKIYAAMQRNQQKDRYQTLDQLFNNKGLVDKRGFIPEVDSPIPQKEMDKYALHDHEFKIELKFNNQTERFSLFVIDFRDCPKSRDDVKSRSCPVSVYCLPFGETDPVAPNLLSGQIIEQAKHNRQVLIIPRFEYMPKNKGGDIEAKLVLEGLKHIAPRLVAKGIHVDLFKHPIEIIGFSDGARIAVELAGIVNNTVKAGKRDQHIGEAKRELFLLSPTAVLQIVPDSSKELGVAFSAKFVKQVAWITIEEVRLRLNANIKAGQVSGIPVIPDPRYAFDKNTIKCVIVALQKIIADPKGRKMFMEEFDDSRAKNLAFLFDVLIRARTAQPNFSCPPAEYGKAILKRHANETSVWLATLDKHPDLKRQVITAIQEKDAATLGKLYLRYPQEMRAALPDGRIDLLASVGAYLRGAWRAVGPFLRQFQANEKRSKVCDGLELFSVKARLPIEDLIYSHDAFGRTLRRNISQFGLPTLLSPSLKDEVQNAIKQKDDVMLGRLLTIHPAKLGSLLFPRARSTEIHFVGKPGTLSATHLAPFARPDKFFEQDFLKIAQLIWDLTNPAN